MLLGRSLDIDLREKLSTLPAVPGLRKGRDDGAMTDGDLSLADDDDVGRLAIRKEMLDERLITLGAPCFAATGALVAAASFGWAVLVEGTDFGACWALVRRKSLAAKVWRGIGFEDE